MSEGLRKYRAWWDAHPWWWRWGMAAWWRFDTVWCGLLGKPGPGERLILRGLRDREAE